MKTARVGVGIALCLAVSALGLAACGSSSGGSDFAAEANAICRTHTKAFVTTFNSPEGAGRSQSDALKAEGEYLEQDEQAERKLRGLEPPAEQKGAFESFVSATEKATEGQRQEQKAVQSGDKSRFEKAAAEDQELSKAATKAAAAVPGLDVCAQKMSSGEEQAVVKTIEANEVKREPSQCSEYLLKNVVVNLYKTPADCRKAQEHAKPAEHSKSVDVEVVEGTDKVAATANVTFHGGEADGQTSEFGMAYEDGKWKLAYFKPKEG